MSDYLIALIAGIVEGLTEFLPVSSTAHIVICQKLMGTDLTSPFWKMFTVVIQLGAILAVVLYFRQRLLAFVHSFWNALRGSSPQPDATISGAEAASSKHWMAHPLMLVLISFIVTAIPCLLINKWSDKNLESPTVIAIAMIVGGFAMVIIDRVFSAKACTASMEAMSLKQAIAIGSAQILAAAFPGTSRSMATIAGGQVMGLSRVAALEFSFFLSIPVMFAAAGYKLLQFIIKEPIALEGSQWITLAIGFGASFVVALAVIAWFMHWVRKHGFLPFAIYRIIVGALILLFLR
ncbi:MAG: undecaprenyl-diphosphate phosphatase [Pirellula sp.]|jgi:undecaprenyl-diphosphatase